MKDIKNKKIERNFEVWDLGLVWGGYGWGNEYRRGTGRGDGYVYRDQSYYGNNPGYDFKTGYGYEHGYKNGNGGSES
jgi:hypothetical protein